MVILPAPSKPFLRSTSATKAFVAALALGMVVLITGCAPGVYPLDIMTEMHYHQSFKSQEPPRLHPPVGSVPITGKEIAYQFEEYKTLEMPKGVLDNYNPKEAAQLYTVNCAICHGQGGKGDGPVGKFLSGFPPADLTGKTAQGSTDGEVYGFLSHGGRIGFIISQSGATSPSPMPTFNKLLTEEERWILTHYVLRDLAQQ